MPHEGWPVRHARGAQHPPEGDWRVWYLKGGRGSGKSRTGAETLAAWILDNPPGEWAVVAPTFGDARDVCVETESGLLPALGGAVRRWNRSHGELWLSGGSRVYLDGADDGALRIQGRNLRGAWCDEVGLWRRHGWERAWQESLQFAVRLHPGRIVVTGTPKAGHPLVRLLLDDETTRVTEMRTLDNAENLDEAALADLLRRFQGRRLGRQELEAEFLEDVEGALWSREQIELLRVDEPPVTMRRVVVAIDPNVSSGEAANEAGIVVAGRGTDGIGYVLADCTVTHGGPRAWAQAAVDAYYEWDADRIVAEKNNGGEMVGLTIRTVDANVPVKLVSASRGKRTRAEPVAALYEGDEPQVRHVGTFPDLEDQQTTWTPSTEAADDRLDALVWALTELMLGGREGGVMQVTSPVGSSLRVPGVDHDTMGWR